MTKKIENKKFWIIMGVLFVVLLFIVIAGNMSSKSEPESFVDEIMNMNEGKSDIQMLLDL